MGWGIPIMGWGTPRMGWGTPRMGEGDPGMGGGSASDQEYKRCKLLVKRMLGRLTVSKKFSVRAIRASWYTMAPQW